MDGGKFRKHLKFSVQSLILLCWFSLDWLPAHDTNGQLNHLKKVTEFEKSQLNSWYILVSANKKTKQNTKIVINSHLLGLSSGLNV